MIGEENYQGYGIKSWISTLSIAPELDFNAVVGDSGGAKCMENHKSTHTPIYIIFTTV